MTRILNLFKGKKETLETRLKKIKDGDKEEREKLISDYQPFIIKAITKVTNKYIETENDDEYSIGLLAFNEAIDKYDFNKGSFLSFAQLLIRNRVIDFLRKESTGQITVSIDDDNVSEVEVKTALVNKDFTIELDMKDQIIKFQDRLDQFGISMEELVESSPKHIDSRLNSIEIAKFIVENMDIKEELYSKKAMPVNVLIARKGVSRKVLKRNRKFIIATVLIIDSDSQLLIEYINGVERRELSGI